MVATTEKTVHDFGPFTVGQYTPSERFKTITNMSCVCRPDDILTLVAVTGPADDRESQMHSDLFAAAPDLLAACVAVRDALQDWQQWALPREVKDKIRIAIEKAEGA